MKFTNNNTSPINLGDEKIVKETLKADKKAEKKANKDLAQRIAELEKALEAQKVLTDNYKNAIPKSVGGILNDWTQSKQSILRKTKAEIELSKETVTMTYSDQQLVSAPNPYSFRINGIGYVLEIDKPTKVHPAHKREVETMLGRYINKKDINFINEDKQT